MDHHVELSAQFTTLAIDLGQMLQAVWQFDALVTFAAIGWGLTVGQSPRPPSRLARLLVASGLSTFYVLNVYVLSHLLERLRAAQELAERYATLASGQDAQAALGIVYQDFPDYVLVGSAAIGASVVVIVYILMGSAARVAPDLPVTETQSLAPTSKAARRSGSAAGRPAAPEG